MGVDVVLNAVDQRGTSSRRRRLTQLDVVPDTRDLFARICGRSKLPMLRRVDPYGDLILSSSEVPQFLEELKAEHELATGDEERLLLTAVSKLAERCLTDPSTELQLQGD